MRYLLIIFLIKSWLTDDGSRNQFLIKLSLIYTIMSATNDRVTQIHTVSIMIRKIKFSSGLIFAVPAIKRVVFQAWDWSVVTKNVSHWLNMSRYLTLNYKVTKPESSDNKSVIRVFGIGSCDKIVTKSSADPRYCLGIWHVARRDPWHLLWHVSRGTGEYEVITLTDNWYVHAHSALSQYFKQMSGSQDAYS